MNTEKEVGLKIRPSDSHYNIYHQDLSLEYHSHMLIQGVKYLGHMLMWFLKRSELLSAHFAPNLSVKDNNNFYTRHITIWKTDFKPNIGDETEKSM